MHFLDSPDSNGPSPSFVACLSLTECLDDELVFDKCPDNLDSNIESVSLSDRSDGELENVYYA